MRICIFGAGALGSAIGGMLASRHEVSIVARRPHVEAVRSAGLQLTGVLRGRARVAAFETIDEAPTPELVIICTKAFDTNTAIESCKRAVDESTKVLTLQNGLGNLDQLRVWKGRKAFGGTTTLGARLVRPGLVQLAGLGETIIGSDVDPVGAKEIAAAFSVSGIRVLTRKDISREIWSKVVVSSCINPLTAILRVPNGVLASNPVLSRLVSEVAKECLQVAAAEGHPMSAQSLVTRVRRVAKATAVNHSSMLQDIERGTKTEISMINGEICRIAAMRSIPVPLNSTLVAIVDSMEHSFSSEKG